jgi:hypothetical protein
MSIFQRKGHTVQGAPDLTASQSFIRGLCPLMGLLGIQGYNGLQRWIVSFNLGQVCFQHIYG